MFQSSWQENFFVVDYKYRNGRRQNFQKKAWCGVHVAAAWSSLFVLQFIVTPEGREVTPSRGGNCYVWNHNQLNAINDVKDFVNKVMLFNYDIDLVSGRYAIDAKSIMGIFSLDLSKPIKLQAHTDDPEKLVESIGKYIVK